MCCNLAECQAAPVKLSVLWVFCSDRPVGDGLRAPKGKAVISKHAILSPGIISHGNVDSSALNQMDCNESTAPV